MGTPFIRLKLCPLFLLTVLGAAAISAFPALSPPLEARAVTGGDGDETPYASRQTSGAVRTPETGRQHEQGRRSPHSGDEGHDTGHPRTTTYLYGGDDIIAEYDGRNQLTRSYLHGAGIDEPLSATKIGKGVKREVLDTYYYNTDGLGSITGLTDDRGHLVQRYEYDSFGNIRHHGNRIKQPYTYTGREYDHETGLYFYRGRYYDPPIGRFINRDPIGFAGGDINLYAYVWNNPANWRDSHGLAGDGQNKWGSDIEAWLTNMSKCSSEECLYNYPPPKPALGHSDFSGNDRFDWVKEDYGETAPLRDPERHLRPFGPSYMDAQKAIEKCNKDEFERAMHRLQDYYFHYAKGYRWEPRKLKLGHFKSSVDNNPVAWARANQDTDKYLKDWDAKCRCK